MRMLEAVCETAFRREPVPLSAADIVLLGNYSRLYTSHSESNFLVYYPTFAGKSNNDAAIALQIQIPLFDRAHQARAQEASADARHALFRGGEPEEPVPGRPREAAPQP